MVNASLNWASIIGILLVLLWIPVATSGIFLIWFILNRRADTLPKVLIKTFLIIFQTIGRAFFIPLAGVIHTDFEKEFIRAQNNSFQNLINSGSIANVKTKTLLRSEGKEYIVNKRNVMEFLFNV